MDAFAYGLITRGALQYRLERESPRNDDVRSGYALVFVHGADAFAEGHIPLSVNIPRGREHEFERRFAKTKEIVLYGEDGSCWPVASVAAALLNRGFVHVYVYEGGLRDWREAGCPMACDGDRKSRRKPALGAGIGRVPKQRHDEQAARL